MQKSTKHPSASLCSSACLFLICSTFVLASFVAVKHCLLLTFLHMSVTHWPVYVYGPLYSVLRVELFMETSNSLSSTQWRLSAVNVGGPGHLSPSFNFPFFPSLSWTLQGLPCRVHLTHCQTFWCSLCSQTALWNPHWCLMFYIVQKSARMRSSAAGGSTDAMFTGSA